MHISRLVFKKKVIFYFLLIAIVAGGLISYNSISKLEDPEIAVMVAKVVTIYPGASAHEVEMQVTNVLEDALSELADIDNIESQSAANVSMIDVRLKLTVPQEEIPQRWDFLRRKIQLASLKLPKGAQQPIVFDDVGDVYGMFYAMTADGYSYREMAEQAQHMKRNLLLVEGVRKVAIYGEQAAAANITLEPQKMAQMGVMPLQVMAAINDHLTPTYGGNLVTGNNQLRVNITGRAANIDDLANIQIKGLNGEMLKLGDLAKIEEGYNEPFRNTLMVNNQKALAISLSMESGENIIKVGKRVQDKIEEMQSQMPAGFNIVKVFNQPDEVNKAIGDFIVNIIMSVAIVILVLMITMGLRSGLIIGSGLLLTIMATFPFMYIVGGTMQRISLGAFIVAMGMLVDNAIVVLDGILVRMKREGRRKSTFTMPAIRTAWPLLGATLIAIAAFLPAVLSKDAAGTYIHDLFVVLCISLFISWILALTQIPLFSAIFLKHDRHAKLQDKEEIYSGKIYRGVRKVLEFSIKHKPVTFGIAIVLLLLCVFNIKNVKKTFFPDFNYSQAYIEYKLPYGTSPDKVNADLAEITTHLLQNEHIDMVVTSQGQSPTRYCLVRPMGEVTDSYGELIVDFDTYESMLEIKPQIEQYLRTTYPNAQSRIRRYNLSIISSHGVEAQFSGPDPAVLRQLSAKAEEIMMNSPYADKNTVSSNWSPQGKSLDVAYQMGNATRNSTSRSDVSMAVLAVTDGLPLGTIYDGETPLTVNLKIRNADGSKIQDISDIPVWNMMPNLDAVNKDAMMSILMGTSSIEELKGKIVRSVPLSSVTGGTQMGWEENMVLRVDRKRSIQAQCDAAEGTSPASLLGAIKPAVEAIPLPEGYTLEWIGEHDMQSIAMRNIFNFLPVTILIIIFLLVLLFNDVRRPLIVLLCIPMAILGIVPGLMLTGKPYTFIAIIGTFGLSGMLIKNSIVLLDEIEKQLHDGRTRYNAIIDATISRTRPVLMASITTILGMLPLCFDPMYSSMAVTIIFGLLVGTLITLVFVPVLYAAFYMVKSH